jgi:hypothetical protein
MIMKTFINKAPVSLNIVSVVIKHVSIVSFSLEQCARSWYVPIGLALLDHIGDDDDRHE